MAARHSILGGKVQLFQRPRSPYWQSTATVGGVQMMASTKQESLALAKQVAEDWYLDLKGRARWGDGLPRQKKRKDGTLFRDAATVFLDEFQALAGGERSAKYVDTLRGKLDNYLVPFFEEKYVDEIDDDMVVAYRIERSKATDKDGNPKPPARTTLHSEIIALRHVLKTCKRKRWIKGLPDLSAPYKASGKISHRAWFSPDEYKRLRTATQKRAAHPSNPKWKWECEQFHDYVLFEANSGLRPDEAGRLEFRDVTITQDGQPIQIPNLEKFREVIAECKAKGLAEPILEIDVRGKRGVGFCKSMPGAVRPFIRLKNRLRAAPEGQPGSTRDRREKLTSRRARGTEPKRERDGRRGVSRGGGQELVLPVATDLIFGPTQREMMNTVLDELSLKFDRDGQPRTAYSLRHTYICFRLMEGADIYQVAKNCRTSVEMIEKYYASHIKNLLDTSAINVRRAKTNANSLIGSLSDEED